MKFATLSSSAEALRLINGSRSTRSFVESEKSRDEKNAAGE